MKPTDKAFAAPYSSLGNFQSTTVLLGITPITGPRFLRQHPEVRALPSTGIARLQRYYDPLRVSAWPPSLPRAEPPGLMFPHSPAPPSLHAVPLTPVDPTGARVGVFPVGAAFPDV